MSHDKIAGSMSEGLKCCPEGAEYLAKTAIRKIKMTDPRIEAAARELKRLFSDDESTTDDTWIACAKCVLEAADAAAWRAIESAPKDSGKLLGADGDDIEVIEYIPLLDAWDNGEQTTYPTHWQPLPKPPTQI